MADLEDEAEPQDLDLMVQDVVDRLRRGEPTTMTGDALRSELADEFQGLLPILIALESSRPQEAEPRHLGETPFTGQSRFLAGYELIREVGRGGMGIVYEAREPALDRRVALKILPRTTLYDDRARQRFLREARALARLRCPHVIPIHAVGEHDGVLFYVMDLIPGTSLDQFVPREGATDTGVARARWVARIGLQAAEALGAAHSQGIWHRDVKPSNFVLDVEGSIWLTDFGLARLLDDPALTASGEWLGTLRYLAPECLRAGGDTRSDLYSLGLTLYELLVGVPAFPEGDRLMLMKQIAETSPIPPRRIDPTIPVDLERILSRTTEREPSDRYQCAAELAEDLRRYLEHQSIPPRPRNPGRRAVRWLRTHRALAFLATLVFLLGSGLMYVTWKKGASPGGTAQAPPDPGVSRTAVPPPMTESDGAAPEVRPSGPPYGLGRRHSPAGAGKGAGRGPGPWGPRGNMHSP